MDTISRVKVIQMESPRSSKPVANQFFIETPEGIYFQSYQSIIAFKRKTDSKVFLDETYWNYSRTTSKYLHQFILSEDRANAYGHSVKDNINNGLYILTNLN